MAKKNEIETKGKEVNTPALIAENMFKESLQGALGLSPLAVGEKFESDDLVAADKVTLWAYDWVNYTENEGTDKEREVNFALWKATVERGGVVIDGYYQGGTILNKLARHIANNNLERELETYGVDISAEWGKTSSKNDILIIKVI